MFVGRKSELSFLENHAGMADSRILVIYGRRGVGKTALLGAFAQDKNFVYYAARSASEREQRYQWGQELSRQGKVIDLFPSYEQLFRISCDTFSDDGQRRVLILDEFHHFVKADSEFMPNLIQFVEDCGKKSPVLVILCSSASGWVENSMISKMGRCALSITGLLKIREMKFAEICRLYPQYSFDDALRVYTALGGNPGLWNSFSPGLSAKENMIRYLLPPGSRLHEEMSVYLAEELRETAVYNSILAVMAKGISKLNDIYQHTGFSRAKISVYLKNLMELDLVEKVSSFECEGYANTQKGIYRICNPYVRFYYRFLYPNQSALQTWDSEAFYEEFVEDDFQQMVEETYRKVCREILSDHYIEMGEWIGKTGVIDIVAKDHQDGIMAAICRYEKAVTLQDYQNLMENLRQARLEPDQVRIYGEKGFDPALLRLTGEERNFGMYIGSIFSS